MAAEVKGGFERAAKIGFDVTRPGHAGTGISSCPSRGPIAASTLSMASFLLMVVRYLLPKGEYLDLDAGLYAFLPFRHNDVAVCFRKGGDD